MFQVSHFYELVVQVIASAQGFDVSVTSGVSRKEFPDRSDEGLTLETSAFLLFTVANLRFQPSC